MLSTLQLALALAFTGFRFSMPSLDSCNDTLPNSHGHRGYKKREATA